MDNLTLEQRNKNMSRIHSTNTKPEKKVREFLFNRGFRYRKNVRALPGCPDIVLPKFKTVVFVNGCFWHKHDCSRFKWPSTNQEYWTAKIQKNVERDKLNCEKLTKLGWRVIIVWECSLKKLSFEKTMSDLIELIKSN